MMPKHSKTHSPAVQRFARKRSSGFTLIESVLTIVIISTGVLAIMGAQQAFHKKNDWAQRNSTGLLLANELRELTLTLPKHDPFTGTATVGPEANENSVTDYDDVDDFAGPVEIVTGVGAGLEFDPPINALRLPIDNMPGWSQRIVVENVLPDNIGSTFTQPLGTTDLLRVTVTVRYLDPMDLRRNPDALPMNVAVLSWVLAGD